MSLALYLITKKGFDVLRALGKNDNYLQFLDCVISAKDKGNQEDFYDEIKSFCFQKGIQFYNRNDNFHNNSKYSIAIGWRWLIMDVTNLIVIHDSYLPKYRGFAPVVNMLIKGENYLAATALWASDRMDEGEIIVQKKRDIQYPIKIKEAIEIVSSLYVDIVSQILQSLICKKALRREIQNHNSATYSIWRDEEDYYINWNDDAEKIVRFVDAVGYPYDGAKTRIDKGDTIKIVECSVVHNITSELTAPGKILMMAEAPVVLCGKDAVSLDKIEDLNGNPYQFKKFRIRLV